MEMDRYIGRLLDNRYEILEVIGTGGMAVVYKARCHRLNRLVAIKILKAEYTKDEEFRRRFHAESQAVAMLSHPNIVSVYDVSATDEADYIVMELIDGITLKQYMEKKGVLNWKETLHFAIQIGKALEHAHSRGIIHRDIKPHNVMVLKNGSVKVTDFGIARVMSKSNTLTKEALGSVHYIAPEQAKGGNVDNRSDLYALGVVMYEMTTGRPPYDGESPVAVAIQHIDGKATLPSVLNPNIPGGLEQIIVRAMAHNPANRYPTAGAMLTDMDEFRKNPDILFDYNNPYTDIDAATRLQPPPRVNQETPPVVRKPPQQTPQRQPRAASSGAAAQKPARRREVIVEEKEERSKVGTVTIIACAAVALVAIIALCIALFGGNLMGSADERTVAPDLVGKIYDENTSYGEVEVIISNRQYSDQYAKGQIIEQIPKANTPMNKGGTVRVVISLGAQPSEKRMEDLSDVPQQNAIDFLNAMKIGLQILPKMENSATVAEGSVIRTDPIEGEILEEGQVVILWISTGPLKQSAEMPNVEGYSREFAIQLLNGAKFHNVTFEEVESDKEKGIVVEQSVPAGLVVDTNTSILLKVSLGPSTNPGGDIPVPPQPDDYTQLLYELEIPQEKLIEDCELTIWYNGQLVDKRYVYLGTVSVTLKLEGKDAMEFTAMLGEDTESAWTFIVNFDSGAEGA
ncbi:MAG: Stk1 family PASTA domain-containing Ser/Thr kinase [Ruminococcaceae bacterium]|nr:Stk1 family PASTA domain-containing Ser/Thr kinase [Oscillospiraceae bacterium]